MTRVLTVKWGVSRGQTSYGYTLCSAWADGTRVAACNGGGYDMWGTVLGGWASREYADRLRALKPQDMPEQSHWEPAEKPSRYCENERCGQSKREGPVIPAGRVEAWIGGADADTDRSAQNCPGCGEWTRLTPGEGRRVDDGRAFYGLTFHDPDYDPGRAALKDPTVFGAKAGETIAEAEARGVSFGLERLREVYRASSKHATERHTVPSIDGACGVSSVERILQAIGITLEQIEHTSKRDVYLVHDARPQGLRCDECRWRGAKGQPSDDGDGIPRCPECHSAALLPLAEGRAAP